MNTNERLDKLRDVLTRDLKEGENIDDMIADLVYVQSETELTWSAAFLKQFNRVCKYEKEQEDEESMNSFRPVGENATEAENKLNYTRILEPLARYTVEKNKTAVADYGTGDKGKEKFKDHLKS